MFRTKKALKITLSGVLLMAMLFSSPQSITYAAENADKVSVSLIGKYDSFDTAAIRDIDTVKKQIRFRKAAWTFGKDIIKNSAHTMASRLPFQ